ncbi:MAG: hypothetical protein QXU22_06430 [Desulfurococcaceae archaeon]
MISAISPDLSHNIEILMNVHGDLEHDSTLIEFSTIFLSHSDNALSRTFKIPLFPQVNGFLTKQHHSDMEQMHTTLLWLIPGISWDNEKCQVATPEAMLMEM